MTRKRFTRAAVLLAGLTVATPLAGAVRSAPPAEAGLCFGIGRVPDRPQWLPNSIRWPVTNEGGKACLNIDPL